MIGLDTDVDGLDNTMIAKVPLIRRDLSDDAPENGDLALWCR